MANFHEKSLTGVGTVEFSTGSDVYHNLIVVPTGTVSYYIEVSNGGGVWFNHPNMFGANPQTGLNVANLRSCVAKVRVRNASGDGTLLFSYSAAEFGRG